jgi:hypothetical protein
MADVAQAQASALSKREKAEQDAKRVVAQATLTALGAQQKELENQQRAIANEQQRVVAQATASALSLAIAENQARVAELAAASALREERTYQELEIIRQDAKAEVAWREWWRALLFFGSVFAIFSVAGFVAVTLYTLFARARARWGIVEHRHGPYRTLRLGDGKYHLSTIQTTQLSRNGKEVAYSDGEDAESEPVLVNAAETITAYASGEVGVVRQGQEAQLVVEFLTKIRERFGGNLVTIPAHSPDWWASAETWQQRKDWLGSLVTSTNGVGTRINHGLTVSKLLIGIERGKFTIPYPAASGEVVLEGVAGKARKARNA